MRQAIIRIFPLPKRAGTAAKIAAAVKVKKAPEGDMIINPMMRRIAANVERAFAELFLIILLLYRFILPVFTGLQHHY